MAGADLRVPFTVCQDAFGLPGVVTRPAPQDTPIATTVVWVFPTTQDEPPSAEFHRRDSMRVVAVKRADVPTLPRGTRIEAPAVLGGTSLTWTVERIDLSESDVIRALVLQEPS